MASLAVPPPPTHKSRPLSSHGLPKAPRVSSPHQPHRFSPRALQQRFSDSVPLTPRSPGPLSPPMSARSIGTFIDSEPSTPAYSPRMDHDWDGSSLVLLRPTSTASDPVSPSEPAWQMMSPVQIAQHNNMASIVKSKTSRVAVETKPLTLAPAPPPVKRTKLSQPNQPVEPPKVTMEPRSEVKLDHDGTSEEKVQDEKPVEASPAPFGKFASKMKSMLRRRSTNDAKKEKKQKDYYDVDRMEDVHWTEY